ncbi:MAG: hypothetical protein A4E19_12775 [Nitrospira sp. SG-bin1]|nr:MAG: hypothetical protein A4E19_12775 [Nitrospira sp. SG-bin1]
MDSPSGTRSPDSFTQSCRDLVRTSTYEDIVACTIYAAPMIFMIGPASIVGNEPIIAIVVQSLIGFMLGWTVHRIGHRLLTTLPPGPCLLYVSPSRGVPVRLTLRQFIWVMEAIVGVAVLGAVVGKRFLHTMDPAGPWSGLSLMAVALVLYFVPVYLGRLWIRHHYPAMSLVGPTEEVIRTSLPGIRTIFTFPRSIDR